MTLPTKVGIIHSVCKRRTWQLGSANSEYSSLWSSCWIPSLLQARYYTVLLFTFLLKTKQTAGDPLHFVLLKFTSRCTSLVKALSPPPLNSARWDANRNHFSFPAEQPWKKKKKKEKESSPCLSLRYTLTWSSFAEALQGKHTLRSQIIDRIITLALQGQCKYWDVDFSWIWYQSCSPKEHNRKWNAKEKGFPNFSVKMWLKKEK